MTPTIDSRPAPAATTPVREMNVALAMPAGSLRDAVLFALREGGAPVVHDHADASDWSGLSSAIAQSGAEVLIFEIGAVGDADAARTIAETKAMSPQIKVIAAYPYDDAGKILSALRAGAHEFIHSPIAPGLSGAFERLRKMAVAQPHSAKYGKLIGFVSAKGGCGATTVACHVGAELRRRTGKDVLLAEFDHSTGPLRFLMKNTNPYSLTDALDNISRLDANFWSALIAGGQPGLGVLPGPSKLTPGDTETERVQRVVRFMRSQHDWSLLDFGRGVNGLLAGAAEDLDELFVVTTVDLPALHMAKAMLRQLPVELEHKPIRLILNRMLKDLEISIDEIQRIFERPVFAAIPDDFTALYQAHAAGTLVRPDSPLGRHFARLAAGLTGETETAKPRKFRFW